MINVLRTPIFENANLETNNVVTPEDIQVQQTQPPVVQPQQPQVININITQAPTTPPVVPVPQPQPALSIPEQTPEQFQQNVNPQQEVPSPMDNLLTQPEKEEFINTQPTQQTPDFSGRQEEIPQNPEEMMIPQQEQPPEEEIPPEEDISDEDLMGDEDGGIPPEVQNIENLNGIQKTILYKKIQEIKSILEKNHGLYVDSNRYSNILYFIDQILIFYNVFDLNQIKNIIDNIIEEVSALETIE